MSRTTWMIGLLAVSLGLLPAKAWAQQEHGGQEHAGATTAAPAAPEEEAAPTPAGPVVPAPAPAPQAPTAPEAAAVPEAPLPPALKPITITFSGELTAVDAQAAPPSITVQDRYGVKKEIAVPAEVKIARGAESKALSDLKAGDKLTVEYTYDVATGKRAAQSISVGEGTAAVR